MHVNTGCKFKFTTAHDLFIFEFENAHDHDLSFGFICTRSCILHFHMNFSTCIYTYMYVCKMQIFLMT